jgi:hypothetical protein
MIVGGDLDGVPKAAFIASIHCDGNCGRPALIQEVIQ